MRQMMRWLVAACLTATAVLALTTASAGARTRVEVSTTAILATGRLTFTGTEFAEIICDLTLHATTSRLINKVRGTLAGSITAILTANARSSIGGPTTCMALNNMFALYDSIRGSLPANITGGSLTVTGGFLISVSSIFGRIGCLYQNTILATGGENPIRIVRVQLNDPLFRTLEGTCPSEGSMVGTMAVAPALTIRLLER
jgi:hypothetical protein